MSAPPVLLKAGATLPHLIASALICLVVGAALPPALAIGLLVVGLVVSVALATGHLEGPAVRVLWLARPPRPDETALLAAPWQRIQERVDVTGLKLWVGGTGYPAFAAGPHHLVLAHPIVAGYRTGRLSTHQVTGHLLHAVGRHRHGRVRHDLLVGFWTYPWDLLRGLGLGIGRRLAWIPLVAFAWRIRFVVGAVAVVQETIAGRPAFAAIIAIFITLTYLTPASRRAWEKYLNDAAVATGRESQNPVTGTATRAR